MNIYRTLHYLMAGLLLFSPLKMVAQDAVEYKMEIGGALGATSGLTDLNSTFFAHQHPGGGAVARFILNPRMAVKTMLSYGSLNGSTTNQKEYYPDYQTQTSTKGSVYKFSGGVVDLGATYELNFWPYGFHKGYQNFSRFTPYIQAGVGFSYSTAKSFTLNLPVGIGFKYKLAQRLNIGLDWQFHFSLSDKLDGLESPTGISSSGFKNKDHYGNTFITLTYDIMPKCPNCNRE